MNWSNLKTVVVPVDFFDASISAVDTALQMVSSPSCIHVIHILPEVSPYDLVAAWEAADDEKRITECKASLLSEFPKDKFPGLQMTVEIGDPASQITDHAERIGAELIVIPSHGRTGLKHLLIGSVAERVCRLAHCAVLILKT